MALSPLMVLQARLGLLVAAAIGFDLGFPGTLIAHQTIFYGIETRGAKPPERHSVRCHVRRHGAWRGPGQPASCAVGMGGRHSTSC
jgi:hypothetical protein